MPAVQFSCIDGLMSNPVIQFFEEYSDLDLHVSQQTEKLRIQVQNLKNGTHQHDPLKGINDSSRLDKYQLCFKNLSFLKYWDEIRCSKG